MLATLAERPNEVVAFKELHERVWGYAGMRGRTADSHIQRVRDKLAAAGSSVELQAVRGVGRRLSPGRPASPARAPAARPTIQSPAQPRANALRIPRFRTTPTPGRDTPTAIIEPMANILPITHNGQLVAAVLPGHAIILTDVPDEIARGSKRCACTPARSSRAAPTAPTATKTRSHTPTPSPPAGQHTRRTSQRNGRVTAGRFASGTSLRSLNRPSEFGSARSLSSRKQPRRRRLAHLRRKTPQ